MSLGHHVSLGVIQDNPTLFRSLLGKGASLLLVSLSLVSEPPFVFPTLTPDLDLPSPSSHQKTCPIAHDSFSHDHLFWHTPSGLIWKQQNNLCLFPSNRGDEHLSYAVEVSGHHWMLEWQIFIYSCSVNEGCKPHWNWQTGHMSLILRGQCHSVPTHCYQAGMPMVLTEPLSFQDEHKILY